jgi:hypothetical protein
VYLETIFVFYYQPQKYTILSLPTVNFFFSVFALCTLAISGSALQLIGVLPQWFCVIATGVIVFLLLMHLLWSYRIISRRAILAAFVVTVVFMELWWALHYWPVTFWVQGFVAAAFFYMIAPLFQLTFRGIVTKAIIRQTISVGTVLLIVVLSTARWTL